MQAFSHRLLVVIAKRGDFNLLLHAGDIAYTSGKQYIWDEFGRDIEGTTAVITQSAPLAAAVSALWLCL